MRAKDLASLDAGGAITVQRRARTIRNGDSVIIGARLANKLGIVPGGTITLIAPRGNVTPFGMTPRIKTYTVAGTFKIGMSEYDAQLRLHAARRRRNFTSTWAIP